jgi:subtilisin family serine protease
MANEDDAPKHDPAKPPSTDPSETFGRVKLPRELNSADRREEWGLPREENQRGPYIIELNLQHIEGLPGATAALQSLCSDIADTNVSLRRVAKTYYACQLTVPEVRRLAAEDEKRAHDAAGRAQNVSPGGLGADPRRYSAIFRIWPDFQVKSHIDRSIATIKADAASRAYAAEGDEIVWAVIDSGVDVAHPHFGDASAAENGDRAATSAHTLLNESVVSLHRCFCELKEIQDGVTVLRYLDDPDDESLGAIADAAVRNEMRAARLREHRAAALADDFGHGTHVAGIIAGGLTQDAQAIAFQREFRADEDGTKIERTFTTRHVSHPERLHGVAPYCKLVSLRVLDDTGDGRTSDVIRALEYIREKINDDPKLLRVHGVNLSVGYEFDAELFACGQSPLCAEVDRLVQAGVVVVAAAGNTGYGHVQAEQRVAKVGLASTINDPGNAALAITVGATHRDSPHTYGVSYFSSKGPTGDGRLKPDLVAPGERITSCATGRKLAEVKLAIRGLPTAVACYVDDSGTSMAAPHVSGAIAAFLSIRREFIGRPLEVKRIFLEGATPLGRERYFEGHGLLDLMRAIQSV